MKQQALLPYNEQYSAVNELTQVAYALRTRAADDLALAQTIETCAKLFARHLDTLPKVSSNDVQDTGG